jgi:phosphoglycolate phosphatase
MKTVIFDLDGTLADTSRDLIEAANACFIGLGLGAQLDPVADARTAFLGGRAMLRLGFKRLGIEDEHAVDGQYPILLDHYEAGIDVYTTLYPGAMDAIDVLRSRGYRIGICTNKPEGLAETLMTRLGVRGAFGSLVGADTLPVRKPDPAPYLAAVTRAGGDPARSLLVGDTDTDRMTSRAAGVPSILVTFGPAGDSVAALDPEGLLPDYAALPRLVEALIG